MPYAKAKEIYEAAAMKKPNYGVVRLSGRRVAIYIEKVKYLLYTIFQQHLIFRRKISIKTYVGLSPKHLYHYIRPNKDVEEAFYQILVSSD